jgi:dihydrofolate reductase
VDAPEDVVQVESIDAAVEVAAATGSDTAFVAGGATVYEQFLPRADRLVLTEVPGEPEGDTYFPEWDRDEWVEHERVEREELAFVTYRRE